MGSLLQARDQILVQQQILAWYCDWEEVRPAHCSPTIALSIAQPIPGDPVSADVYSRRNRPYPTEYRHSSSPNPG